MRIPPFQSAMKQKTSSLGPAAQILFFGIFLSFNASSYLFAGQPASQPAPQEHLKPQAYASERPSGFQPSVSLQQSPNEESDSQHSSASLLVIVNDENGLAVPFAHVTLAQSSSQSVEKGETDYAGRYLFRGLAAGSYVLRVDKEGFYAARFSKIEVSTSGTTEVKLNRVREIHEQVNVVASPATINPTKTTSTHRLSDNEIMNLPVSVPRDIRYALPLIPGVVQDATGQVHVNGSPTRDILDELDGFNITDPASGYFDTRVPVDALRSVTVYGSRYPAQFGKASGGIIDLESGMGDDRYRFSGTDLVPSVSTNKGFHLSGWTPHGSISGPIKKGKAWFLLAPDAVYDLTLINELPRGANSASQWRWGDLAKAQINLTPSNILTTDFLVNGFRSGHAGLSPFNPIETTTSVNESIYHLSAIDRAQLSNGLLAEFGVGFSRFHTAVLPQGNATYVETPQGASGNYFEHAEGRSQRLQVIGNLVAPTIRQWGNHEIRIGFDLDHIEYIASYNRHNISILREDGTLSRTVSFPGNPSFDQTNFETGVYAEDHWSVSHHLVVDPGLRLAWDRIAAGTRVSPRVAASFIPTVDDNTKIVAGAGIYYDETNLDLYTEPRSGTRIDSFYDSTGTNLIRPPVQSVFLIDPQGLKKPWFLNWSAGIEHRLPASIFLRMEYLQKRGYNGWTYVNPCTGANGCFTGRFTLESARKDRYDSVMLSAQKRFRRGHVIHVSYTHSEARSNAVLDFNIENPYFSPQSGGSLPWDTPNRVVSWGILPLVKQFDLAYTLDWHDGFPFSVVNENQQLVGPPDRLRFPAHFTLNMALERRISLFGFRWQVRAGFDDITDRHNSYSVDNNIDSPTFLTYGSTGGRSLTGQVRLLGRH